MIYLSNQMNLNSVIKLDPCTIVTVLSLSWIQRQVAEIHNLSLT